jgi:hypothetical protein
MSYHNDPSMNRREQKIRDDRNNAGMWIGGLAAVAIIAGIIAYAVSNNNTNTASNNQPAANSPASTTGSGSNMPTNPAGTTPQRDNTPPARQTR